jgi:hypothetical protein
MVASVIYGQHAKWRVIKTILIGHYIGVYTMTERLSLLLFSIFLAIDQSLIVPQVG